MRFNCEVDLMLKKNLKKLRGKRTQEEIANKLGIARARYSHYENGIREPNKDMLKAMANLHNVTVDALLGRTEILSNNNKELSKDECDIAKRMERLRNDLEHSDGLTFNGDPMSEEAKEALLESMKLLFIQTQVINKKYTSKKYCEDK